MRNRSKMIALCTVMLIAILASVPAQAADSLKLDDGAQKITLTEKQQKNLASQYNEILKREKKLIATYVKYGVITEEQGKMISDHLDKRFEKLKQNGFIPQWCKHKHKHDNKRGEMSEYKHEHKSEQPNQHKAENPAEQKSENKAEQHKQAK